MTRIENLRSRVTRPARVSAGHLSETYHLGPGIDVFVWNGRILAHDGGLACFPRYDLEIVKRYGIFFPAVRAVTRSFWDEELKPCLLGLLDGRLCTLRAGRESIFDQIVDDFSVISSEYLGYPERRFYKERDGITYVTIDLPRGAHLLR